MTEEYIKHNPGDLITSENWNEMQIKIKKDIEDKIKSAKEQIKETGVDKAGSADKFDNKTPKDWTDELDQRYAPDVHDHEGQTVYRRYYKRFTKDTPTAFLHHKLGRFPLVDIYELLPVSNKVTTNADIESSDGNPTKFFLYYHHEEADEYEMNVKVYREKVPLGIPLETVLTECGVEWEDDDTLQDVRNDLWEKLFNLPNDEISHAFSPWIKNNERLKISELKENDEWPDIRLAFRPQKLEVISRPNNFVRGEAVPTEDDRQVAPAPILIPVTHINYDTLLAEITGDLDASIDMMLLLRI